MKRYDVVIVGLGIMGAAAAWHASRLGASVLAVEKGGPTHREGSSHGATRIFRRAYWEGRRYLDLLALADQGWRRLQEASKTPLIVESGGLFIGPRKTGVVSGSLSTASWGGVEHEHLDAAGLRERFPQFSVDDDMEAVHEPGAYAVLAEEARLQMLNQAVSRGAHLCYGEDVEAIGVEDGRSVVTTRSGRSVTADAVLACAGAGNVALLPELAPVLRPERVPIYWFKPRPGFDRSFAADAFPVFLYEMADGALLYGVAAGLSSEDGVKIGFHNRQHIPLSAGGAPPAIAPYEREIERCVRLVFPDLVPATIDRRWCVYTMALDESFILDRSASHPNLAHVSACSGHGFKFAPAIGQVLVERSLGLQVSADLDAFALSRFN